MRKEWDLTSSTLFLLFVLQAAGAVASPSSDGIDYVNALRNSANMTELQRNDALADAAYNHSNYLFLNHVVGHYQKSGNPGFTGVTPTDRAVYSGYLSTSISENVSYGQGTVADSIDGLMSAIYHRFGFLQTDINEIGVGVRGGFYTYNLGNSLLNTLCDGDSYVGGGHYFYGVCANQQFRISSPAYRNAKEQISISNPALVLWPPDNATDVPPVFFEETPDPLPGHGVTGYPISIEFNKAHFPNSVSLQDFVVFDDNGSELSYAHRVLEPGDDYNGLFTDRQFAVFPLLRLSWGKTYRAVVEYTNNGEAKTQAWYFTTRTLPHRYYQVEGKTASTLTVISGQDYSVYFVPRHSNDRFNSYSYSRLGGMSVNAAFLDGNTININVTGAIGQRASFTFSNGQRLTLILAQADSAKDNKIVSDSDSDGSNDAIDNCPTVPNLDQSDLDGDGLGDVCDDDIDGDRLPNAWESNIGLNPHLATDAHGDLDNDGISNIAEYEAGTDATDPVDPLNKALTVIPSIILLLID